MNPAFSPAWLCDAELNPVEFRVYHRINRRGECTESIASMVAGCLISESTVRRALQTLERQGLLQVEVRPGRPTVYRALTRTTGDTPLPATRINHETPFDGTRTTGDTPPVPLVTPKGSPLKDKNTYSDSWMVFRAIYPKRQGGANLAAAEPKFLSAIQAGATPQEIVAGATAYAAHCDREEKTGTQYVAQATTWLNQKRWTEDYAPNGKPNGKADYSEFKTKESWTQQH